MDSLTRDSISLRGAGVVTVIQPKKGARFTLDALLLADFCRVKPWDHILEPGAGTGIVSLLLARKHPRSHIVCIERQKTLAHVCERNIAENRLEGRIKLLEEDIRKLPASIKASSVDLIVANPPYTGAQAGKQSPSEERASSRQERFGGLGDWLGLQRYLKNKGRFVVVFPAERLADLVTLLRSRALEPKLLRLAHPAAAKPASLVLLEAVKAAGPGLKVLPPLIIHDETGGYSPEMKDLYGLP